MRAWILDASLILFTKSKEAMETVETYELRELARLLRYNAAYCKMLLKKMGHDPSDRIDEDTAQKLADKLSRPWPPTQH